VLQRQYKKHLFRARVVKELYVTEQTYVESLDKALLTFAVPLRQLIESGKQICTTEDVNAMFSRLEDIRAVNNALCDKMARRVDKWTVDHVIGDIFVEALTKPIYGLDFSKVYADYTLSYNHVLETLERCSKNKSFKEFIKIGEKSFWGNAGNSIQAFFILPIQRITRYILLFKEIIKHTLPGHPDLETLRSVLVEMEQMCGDVNENQRREDLEKTRVQTLTAIASKLDPKLKDLVVEGRFLAKEGVLNQFDPEDDQIKERYYYLFNDIMLLTRETKKAKFQIRVHISLSNVRLKDIPDNQNFLGHVITNAFEIHTASMSLMCMTATAEEKQSLYQHIQELVNNLKGTTGTE